MNACVQQACRLGGYAFAPATNQPYSLSAERTACRLGVRVGYWGLGLTREDQLAIVRRPSGWATTASGRAEAYGSDAATILGWIAGQTTKIQHRLGDLPDARRARRR